MSEDFSFDMEGIVAASAREIVSDSQLHLNFVFDDQRTLIYCNPAALQFFGVSSIEEIRKMIPNLLNRQQPDGQNSMEVLMQKFDEAEDAASTQFEYVLIAKDGTMTVNMMLSRIPYRDGYFFIASGYSFRALKEIEKKLEKQEIYLAALNDVGSILLSSKHATFDESMIDVIAVVGKSFGMASQVSVCRFLSGEEPHDCCVLYRWRSDTDTGVKEPPNNIFCIPNTWKKALLRGEAITMRISEADEAEMEFLNARNIKSTMIAPIISGDIVWGCIPLVAEDFERVHTAAAINALFSVANMVASALLNNVATDTLLDSLDENRTLLESNPFSSILFDESGRIVDCNFEARKFFNLQNSEDMNNDFYAMIASSIPEYHTSGKKSVPLRNRIATTFKEGFCEFETTFVIEGRQLHNSVIMKRIVIKDKPVAAAYMFDLTTHKEIQKDLAYHDKLLDALGNVANLLLTADASEFDKTLHFSFDFIGRAADADRVYVWKNSVGDDGKLYTSQIYEWSPDAEAQQGGEFAVNVAFDDVVPRWRDTLQKGFSINGPVKRMSPQEQAHLLPQGVMSIILVPIFLQDTFWGFMGFDDCHKERVFTDAEENVLRICGFMIMVLSDTIKNEIAIKLMAAREAALASVQTKSNFLANMSHEIRTPMNVILGMTELILQENTTDVVLNYAADIKNACRGLIVIINDILDISRIESGKVSIVPVRYHISSLLMDVISIIKIRADKKGIALIVNIDPSIPCELIGDETRIKQILINLLNNAVKFTHEGTISLSIHGKTENDHCTLTCSVSDTGIGIKEEDFEHIFVLFEQVDTKKNRDIEGTGLGLSISRQLAELMGGRISVKSKYHVGSTFTLTVGQTVANNHALSVLKSPSDNTSLIYESRKAYLDSLTFSLDSLGCSYKICLSQSEAMEQLKSVKFDYVFVSSLHITKFRPMIERAQPNAVIIVLNGDGNPYLKEGLISIAMPIHCMQIANILNGDYSSYETRYSNVHGEGLSAPTAKILVVDDNLVNLKVAKGMLNLYQIQADMASGGLSAIKMAQENDYDLIFMDHMMPNMDGVDTTIAIRQLGEKYTSLPIVALTANAGSGVREMFEAEGLDDFLAKPVELSKLEAILKKWLPKDKVKKKNKAAVREDAGPKIVGLDTQKGLQSTGGNPENYLDILSTYVSDCEHRLLNIEQFHAMDNLKALTTCVHAMKSASASIGAMDVSRMAADLEAAGHNGDTMYIDANLKLFTSELSALLPNIRAFLEAEKSDAEPEKKNADPEFWSKALSEIRTHMDSMDIDAIERVLDDICTYKWDPKTASHIEALKSHLATFDYIGMETAITNLLVNSERDQM